MHLLSKFTKPLAVSKIVKLVLQKAIAYFYENLYCKHVHSGSSSSPLGLLVDTNKLRVHSDVLMEEKLIVVCVGGIMNTIIFFILCSIY